jgi:hypothetical protein
MCALRRQQGAGAACALLRTHRRAAHAVIRLSLIRLSLIRLSLIRLSLTGARPTPSSASAPPRPAQCRDARPCPTAPLPNVPAGHSVAVLAPQPRQLLLAMAALGCSLAEAVGRESEAFGFWGV